MTSKPKNLEVELRAPITHEGYASFMDFLRTNAEHVGRLNRVLLDYSTFLEGIGTRKTDVRVRRTNGDTEIIVKKGSFGGSAREEASIFPKDNDLANTLRLMHMLGYSKAVACVRSIDRYMCDGIEISIQDARAFSDPEAVYSRFCEFEIMCADEAQRSAAVKKIQAFMREHGLSAFAEDAWNSYVEKLNREANGIFEYSLEQVDRLSVLGLPTDR